MMRKLSAWIGYATIPVTLAVLGAPLARADDGGFVAAARAIGVQQPADYVIRSGRSACLLLKMGSTPDKLADRMTTMGLDENQAHQFIALSVHDFCPQFDGQLPPGQPT